jgi:CelD/BcsL family acetyltransferase involved in cellulose biosynthesis
MIYRIDPTTDRRWQVFVEDHPDAGIFHTAQWIEALHRTYGYKAVVYTSTPPGENITNGIPFCQVRSRLTGRRFVSLPFSDHCQPLVRTPEELHEIIAAAGKDIMDNGWKYLELKPLLRCSPDTVQKLQLMTSHDAVIHRLDLSRSREEILRGFHKDCILRKIARSDREQLKYEEGVSEDLLQKFYRLLLLTRRRHHIPPQPVLWFRNLIACLRERLKIRIASLKDGTPAAGILTLSYKRVVTYKYGCSDPQFNALGGTVMLIWRTVQDALGEGALELDLGRSDHDTPGLVAFKNHWGAAQSGITYYRYPAAATVVNKHGFVAAARRRVIAAVPDSVLAGIGGLFYKHVA